VALELRTQELSHSLSLMRATFESTADGILVTEHTGRVVTFNEQFLQIWGFLASLWKAPRMPIWCSTSCTCFANPLDSRAASKTSTGRRAPKC